ncbi:hypothetical protein [Streptomyces lavenduligriseus]|uniref:Uncharacterized protein n=1 Tax=Streptomyces lavenduligriseus TaxID=67315 RepID=A0ABT0NKQ9_9ACTN|nr:hypothetical protein [Streptomyces lavenduligriseus]MCL3992059.1 hypothetical protein [Streptomyces lavenduligriseus]
MSDTVLAVAALLSHQQAADLMSARHMCTPSPAAILDASPPTVHEIVSGPSWL